MRQPTSMAISATLAEGKLPAFQHFVRSRIIGHERALAALDAAEGKSADSPEVRVLAAELERIHDVPFQTELRARWDSIQHATRSGTVNEISGTVYGKVVQARDIHGDLSF
ncbi:hypothetical protein [Kibdelosporangium phytohabitans]|uniref:Uncharacterized protein n=1 Tax=Kibdelosporangium phytohabitans TaxID=860235 RepID=A0A0N9HR36_9PSEU|nr:hypothetical protein [Kibdelosporangium phytohabitans]ALG09651.1 hypothetical protein AOZ06_24550 [Kibdelosporangium phytohabitans]MBE1469005.1 hypothetical protein [Kibdelosporangium phytohabitans]